jgi:ribose transport system ATP-binding protein
VTQPGDIVLEARGISKSFPGVRALDDVSITLRSGRLTALLGENGAGKSTLMNVIAGVTTADAGEVTLAGETLHFSNPGEARDAGIAMIFQELNLVPNLSVAENIYLGREPLTRLGLIDFAKMYRDATGLLERLGLNLDPATPLGQLRVGQQQLVEIARAISSRARVLIMDEPTSAITGHEIENLFGIVETLKREGVAIAYITHKLEELARIGDDAVIMRDGRLIGAARLAELRRDDIVQMMIGREGRRRQERETPAAGPEVLRVKDLSLAHPARPGGFLFRDVSFSARRGEVLGVFGLMGAGRTELLETLFGMHPRDSSGDVFVGGRAVEIRSPVDAIALGIGLAPEDRKSAGLVLGMSVAGNTSLACLSHFDRHGLVDEKAEHRMVEEAIARFRIKTPSLLQAVRNLSGGNQQKVILGKWLATEPAILLLDEPTRGIDVNAKDEIYRIIHALSDSGLAVIVVSSELEEILFMADRLIVMCEGRVTAEFDRGQANEETVMQAALPAGALH